MPQPRRWIDALLAATFLCGLNALKPPVADDPAYLYFARQIAAHPGDPYGFTIHWYDDPQPAMTVLAPPVFPYWLGLGVVVLGDDPMLLKLWCWPWCFALTVGLTLLLRRFAPCVERSILWFIALSPAVLPAVNLMLDVPALALSLLAVVAMLAAAERNSFELAAVAGLLAGLAMQTKYTGFTTPAVLVLATGRSRWRLTVVAWLAAFGVFAGWEWFLVQRYGESHFVYHLTHGTESARRTNLIGPLFTLVGGVGGALVPLSLAALGASARAVVSTAVVVVGSYAAIAVAPPGSASAWLSWETLVFGITGVAAIGLLSTAAFVACRGGLFLVSWLVVEVAGYLVLSPWPAARRVVAIAVVGALLLAWLAARTNPHGRLVWVAAFVSVAFGLLYQAADIDEAWASRTAVRRANQFLRGRDESLHVWFIGRHGMQYESERVGWRKHSDSPSKRPSVWYLVIDEADRTWPHDQCPNEPLHTIPIRCRLPWATQPAYSGMKVPLQGRTTRPVVLAVRRCRDRP